MVTLLWKQDREVMLVRDVRDLTVVMLSDKAWEHLELVPITDPVPLEAWLGFVQDERMQITAEPDSLIEGGPYAGRHVLTLDNQDGRSRFAVPAAAIPMLQSYMSSHSYHDLLGRTRGPRRGDR